MAQVGGSPRAAVEAVKAELGLERLESFPVVHCAHAFGLALASRDGWSLALSGDTRPCAAVVTAAKDATVLIHEVCACHFYCHWLSLHAELPNHQSSSDAMPVRITATGWRAWFLLRGCT